MQETVKVLQAPAVPNEPESAQEPTAPAKAASGGAAAMVAVLVRHTLTRRPAGRCRERVADRRA
jgi:hypothetical protein